MSLTPLNFNSNGAPEPSEDNTITLREYTGGPIAQFDAEQNFINFKGRVNDLLNSVSNLTSTVSSNQSSLQTEISNLSTTLTNSINSSNAAQDATIASNLATLTDNLDTATANLANSLQTDSLVVNGEVSTGPLTVNASYSSSTSSSGSGSTTVVGGGSSAAFRMKDLSGNAECLFHTNDDYESLTITPYVKNGVTTRGSVRLSNSDLEVGGDAQIEGNLIVQGKVQGNLDIQGNITVSGEVNSDRAGWNFVTPVQVVPHYFGGTAVQRHKVFGVGGIPANASKALLQWQTHQGYVQIRNPNGHGHITVGNIGDNQDGSAVFVVENIQLPLNQNVGPSTSSLSVPTSKTHSNMIPEGHIEFVLGDANHDGPSRHVFIKAIAYML
ncbi:polymer-forming cytoskeletal protein [Opitutales bacterium]|nr:polymer-forming cytoskeletal protein [Opitutales bacterium]